MTFDLDPSVHFSRTHAGRGQLAVFEPTTTRPLDSHRILVRTAAGPVAYLSGARWAASLPNLVQDRLIGGFETAHVVRAVGRPGDLLADRSLHADVQHFEIDLAHKRAVVAIYARIVANDGRTVVEKMFSATAPAANSHRAVVAKALNRAFAKVVHDIVIWAGPHA